MRSGSSALRATGTGAKAAINAAVIVRLRAPRINESDDWCTICSCGPPSPTVLLPRTEEKRQCPGSDVCIPLQHARLQTREPKGNPNPAPGLQHQIPVLADDILAEAAPRLA